jgi:RimJ/RimL family protein N-acetyltransferase
MTNYIILKQQKFVFKNYSIVPIRFQDRYLIMNWRNEQMYHLRQEQLLTKDSQDLYFTNTVKKLFEEKYPKQILFSYLNGTDCIGYGGLVHINWADKNAEISFIMKTELETFEFELHWKSFLTMINQIAKNELGFIKTYTYAFDLRSGLYNVLEDFGYEQEARLRNHKQIDGKFIDVIIHSKIYEKNKI